MRGARLSPERCGRTARGLLVVAATAAAAACAALPSAGCSGSRSGQAPVATLATSVEAQQSFQTIRHRWLLAGSSERLALEPALQEFRARFPTDPLARLANVYLAWLALERGDFETARALSDRVRSGPSGSTQELASLVAGAVLCRQGKPEPALDLLTPLVGKLIDPYAQSMLHEQIVDATVQARRWFEALAYMDDWLRSAEPHELDAIRRRVDGLLATFPPESLEVALRSMKASKGVGGYGQDIRTAVAAQLSRIAIKRADARLARTVLESHSSVEVLGETGDALAHLASSGGAVARIVDATVGMVLPAHEKALRARGAQAVAGALEAFGPSQSAVESDAGAGLAPADSPGLITRDHRDITAPSRKPFDDLAHEGAALLIAGFDGESALLASRFAESESIPVILLTAPSEPLAATRFTFVLGESEERLLSAMMEAAGRTGRKAARVGGPAPTLQQESWVASCDARAAHAGDLRFPLQRWRTQGVGTLVLAGSSQCASDVLGELSQARYSPALVVGPEAWGATVPPGYAGQQLRAKVGMLGAGQRDDSVRAWIQAHGEAPGWYEALGRDAAVLARMAVAALPKGTVTEPKEVAARRMQARQGLLAARAPLWTTNALGFEPGGTVSREILFD
jgi:predicted negative regulator of RcsB-dependent stress response